MKNLFCAAALALLLITITFLAFNIQPVNGGTITVPDDYPTIQGAVNAASENDTIFVRNGTYFENVVVNKTVSLVGEDAENTIIDGGNVSYVALIVVDNVNVTGFTIRNSGTYGAGIMLESAAHCNISGNTMTNNFGGVLLVSSSNNTVSGNNIANNVYGVDLYSSSGNKFFHNNFTDNTQQVIIGISGANMWDDGYPGGGNYWSNYNGTDLFNGPHQNETGSDGIGDTAYIIDVDNADHYPLMGMFSDFNATPEFNIQTICNSTISNFNFTGTTVSFDVTGNNGTAGFCRICIPTTLINGLFQVFVNGTQVPYNLLPCSNTTNSYLYFNYTHSTEQVVILIPEFPTFLILPLFMIATLLAVIVFRRRKGGTYG